MTPTRILTRRRLGTAAAHPVPANLRRRRRTRGFVQVAGVASQRLRLDALGHAYLVAGAALIGLMFYLAVAAQITQSSYEISQLQDQQRQLVADQDQLLYQEATLKSPAQLQQQAAQSGMQRVVLGKVLSGPPVAIDLTQPVGAPATDSTPLWARMVASAISTVSGTRDVLASTGK
ncbi:MAG: hypothetical protein ACHQ0J_07205 [Candidatus Dormibacterales bacterium]